MDPHLRRKNYVCNTEQQGGFLLEARDLIVDYLANEILCREQGQHFARDNRATGVLSGSILLAHLAIGPTAILNVHQP